MIDVWVTRGDGRRAYILAENVTVDKEHNACEVHLPGGQWYRLDLSKVRVSVAVWEVIDSLDDTGVLVRKLMKVERRMGV